MGLFTKKAEEKTSDKLVNEFLNKSEGLQRILEKETEYFREMKSKQAGMLIETKLNLIEEIETIKSALVANPTALKSLGESEKNKIRTSGVGLMTAAEDNYNETLKAKEVNKLILEAISEAVLQNTRVDGAYGEKGNVYKNDISNKPVAINQNA